MPRRAVFAPNNRNKSPGRVVVLLLLISLSLSGCTLPAYYAQAVHGQVSLLWRSESIHSVISDPSVSVSRRQQLVLTSRIRRFAVEHLALPDNASYTRVVDVRRPYVLWNVFAAPTFSTASTLCCEAAPLPRCAKSCAAPFATGTRAATRTRLASFVLCGPSRAARAAARARLCG